MAGLARKRPLATTGDSCCAAPPAPIRIGDASIQRELARLSRCKVGLSHNLAPAGKICLHSLRKRVGASWLGASTMPLETFDNLWIGQYLVKRLIEAIDGCRGRTGRRKQPVPLHDIHPRNAQLGKRRHAEKVFQALRSWHRPGP